MQAEPPGKILLDGKIEPSPIVLIFISQPRYDFWAADPEGRCLVECREYSVRPYIRSPQATRSGPLALRPGPRARVYRPGLSGQGPNARAPRPGPPGQGLQDRTLRPELPGQGPQARAPNQGSQAGQGSRPGPPGHNLKTLRRVWSI